MDTKSIFASKTAWAAAALTLLGAIQGLDWAHLLPSNPQAVGWVATGIGIVMFALRSITSTPVSLTGK